MFVHWGYELSNPDDALGVQLPQPAWILHPLTPTWELRVFTAQPAHSQMIKDRGTGIDPVQVLRVDWKVPFWGFDVVLAALQADPSRFKVGSHIKYITALKGRAVSPTVVGRAVLGPSAVYELVTGDGAQ
jgi:hypothetical protein